MGSVWDNRAYKECLIRLQPEERGPGAWIPRCTILCGQAGKEVLHPLTCEDSPQPTRDSAGQYAFDQARKWIDQNV
jgi:hypothetical protein